MIIGSNLLFFESLPSTNSHTTCLLKKKRLQEGTIIYTNYQSAGKGYSGNRWESEEGKNLLISIVLLPSFVKPEEQFYISMTISLGICDFLMRFVPACSIKWPNDIYVINDKIAGILIESTLIGDQMEFSIAGLGININQEKFLSTLPNPVSLCQITGINFDLHDCLIQLAADLDNRYKKLIAGNWGQIKKEYVSRLYRLNEWSEFRDIKGTYTGRILTVGDNGRIKIVRRDREIREYAFKELEFIL